MKKLLTNISEIIGFILSFLWSPSLSTMLASLKNHIYTGYLRRFFYHFGNSNIMYPLYHFEGLKYISIGDRTIIEPNVQLTAKAIDSCPPKISIGNGCLIRKGTHITAINSILIGDGLLTGTNVFISDNSHGNTEIATLRQPVRERNIISKGRVRIGNNVWLGNNVCVLAGVTIGDGAIVGANSIVTHDVAAYTIVAGSPAQVINKKA